MSKNSEKFIRSDEFQAFKKLAEKLEVTVYCCVLKNQDELTAEHHIFESMMSGVTAFNIIKSLFNEIIEETDLTDSELITELIRSISIDKAKTLEQ